MSNVNCPYDSQYCQKKDQIFSGWVEIVTNYTIPQPINPDTFSGCAIGSEEERKKTCERYQRYLFITNNVKGNAK